MHFSIIGSFSDASDIDIDLLAVILHQRVPKLNEFYLEMTIPESLASTLQDSNWQRMRQLYPLFNYFHMNPSTQNTPERLIIESKRRI